VDLIGLTDHDTTMGWSAAAAAAEQIGVAVLRGAEVSCYRGRLSVHLLSYLHDPEHPGLAAEFAAARESRRTRAERIVASLSAEFDITWADVVSRVGPEATVGRPHIADALVAKGYFRRRDDVFADVLSSSSPHYASYYAPDPAVATSLIRQAGGVPVLAHPFASSRGRTLDLEQIEELIDAGLAGLEVHHRDNDPGRVPALLSVARRHDLVVTGGSDYHGAGKPNRLGENTTSPQAVQRIAAAGRLEILPARMSG
jgi:predicted metal-dependent phosphoesterase TrpH